ncbi:hypothetical protein PQ455_16450 [Sphingomonas naphthae]|uniref:Uncharacterized protein n=1 Tax=Sphingomonas naphthae TaxID=1813468 RepID=A0ABY7TUF6_9SPHN|nr:hypothetical protein [Sphingomonas naphthae]WCT75489.1 hypothetical protein PQ455_16450 [Sphingomonas naphthae]
MPFLILTALAAGPAAARDALGVYGGWGAFSDAAAPRCYAIAEPRRAKVEGWRPFASVSTWPRRKIRGQLHIRLSRQRAGYAEVTAAIGERRFPLVAGAADAWAADPRGDAAIIAAMRSGEALRVVSHDTTGHRFADTYELRGAATAIDAAALACARLR